MAHFKNVDIDNIANIYFEGKVVSWNIFLTDGTKKTLGVMFIGEYLFSTVLRERIEIISGELKLKLEGEDDWTIISEGDNFNIPKNSSFNIKVLELVNYTCSYFDN